MEEHLSPRVTVCGQNSDQVVSSALCIPESTLTQNVQSLMVKGSTVPAGSEPSVCRLRTVAETLQANIDEINETATIESQLKFGDIADTCARKIMGIETTGIVLLYIDREFMITSTEEYSVLC